MMNHLNSLIIKSFLHLNLILNHKTSKNSNANLWIPNQINNITLTHWLDLLPIKLKTFVLLWNKSAEFLLFSLIKFIPIICKSSTMAWTATTTTITIMVSIVVHLNRMLVKIRLLLKVWSWISLTSLLPLPHLTTINLLLILCLVAIVN